MKSALKIYRLLQKPSESDLNTIIYLTKQIREVEKFEWKRNYEYHQTRLHELVMMRNAAIEAYRESKSIKLSALDIYCICTGINKSGANLVVTATT